MTRENTVFRWSKARELAARLVADDELSDDQIAARCGIGRATLARWKRHPVFRGRVAQYGALWRQQVEREGIADRLQRLRALHDRWRRLQAVIAARAADPAVQAVPGGTTGLLTRTVKVVGAGPNATMVEEYQVDVGLLKELREHEKQAAIELGQWEEKQDHGGTIRIEVIYDHDPAAPAPPAPVPG